MDTFDFSSSRALFERAGRVIPGGIYGHYGLATMTPNTPLYFSKAEGSHFVDVDGNKFIDYMCAYGPSILGYNHPVVDAAAREQVNHGNTVTLTSPIMVELAEKCRFRDCRHENEPGCAVRGGLEDGSIDPVRFDSWLELRKELIWLESRRGEKSRRKSEQQGIFIAKYSREMKNGKEIW